MSHEDKVLLEAASYILLIICSPFIYKMVYAFSLPFWRWLFPINKIQITVVRNGVECEEVVDISNDKKLIAALMHSKPRKVG